jgi:hypothetical protein
MSTPPKSPGFPFKTLLWIVFALIVVFLFRDPLVKLLEDAEEVTIWDKVKIKVSQADVKKLEAAQADYQKEIAKLQDMISIQNSTINGLTVIKEQLERDIADCPKAEESARAFNDEFIKIKENNKDINAYSDRLRETSLLKVERIR